MKLLPLSMCLAASCWAAITGPIASSVDTTLATSLTTTAINSTGGTLIVLVAGGSGGQDPSAYTVSDKVGGIATGNIWHHLTSQIQGTANTVVIWYTYNSGGALVTGANHTVTFTNGNSLAYSGVVTVWQGTLTASDPYEGHQNGAHNDPIQTLSSGNITPGVNNCLVISGGSFRSQPIPYTNTLATIDQTATWVVSARTGIGSSHTIQTTATLVSSSWTMTAGSGQIAVTIAAFLPSTGSTLVKHQVNQ